MIVECNNDKNVWWTKWCGDNNGRTMWKKHFSLSTIQASRMQKKLIKSNRELVNEKFAFLRFNAKSNMTILSKFSNMRPFYKHSLGSLHLLIGLGFSDRYLSDIIGNLQGNFSLH